MTLLLALILTISVLHATLVCVGLSRDGGSAFDFVTGAIFWFFCWPFMSTLIMYRAVMSQP